MDKDSLQVGESVFLMKKEFATCEIYIYGFDIFNTNAYVVYTLIYRYEVEINILVLYLFLLSEVYMEIVG